MQITPQQAVEVLNQAIEADRNAIQSLVSPRVECNEQLANHPTIQACAWIEGMSTTYQVGFIGLLNGLFGVDEFGSGPIYSMYDDSGQLMKFGLTEGLRHSNQSESATAGP